MSQMFNNGHIGITRKGICDECPFVDLGIDCLDLTNGKYLVANCAHSNACERAFTLGREAKENESRNSQ